MSILQEKLDFLLDKYAVANKATLTEDGKCVTVAGKTYPILPWRSERRFAELKRWWIPKPLAASATSRL